MKALILTLILILTPIAASAQVVEELASNNAGAPFIRLHNYLPRWVSCYYSDDYNYFTFTIAPQTTTMWQPIYGTYIWQCN